MASTRRGVLKECGCTIHNTYSPIRHVSRSARVEKSVNVPQPIRQVHPFTQFKIHISKDRMLFCNIPDLIISSWMASQKQSNKAAQRQAKLCFHEHMWYYLLNIARHAQTHLYSVIQNSSTIDQIHWTNRRL